MFREHHSQLGGKNQPKGKSAESPPYREAYDRILKKIEGSIQEEKTFNREWQESLKRLDEDEKKKQDIREAMNKHYFKQLKEQIAERQTNRYSQSQPRGTETEFMKEEGYVWKGMNREQWRNVLDWQIQEKKKIKDELKKKEIEKDRTRLENAQKSLNDEMKLREIKKKKAQNDMWDSWEKTKEVARMQRELEKIRRYGDSVQPRNQYTPGRRNGDYFENILKGYENTFGKIEGGVAGNTGKYIVSTRRLFRKNSKNSLMNASSYTNASIKLGDLIREEEELKTQKIELMKILNKTKNKNRPFQEKLNDN